MLEIGLGNFLRNGTESRIISVLEFFDQISIPPFHLLSWATWVAILLPWFIAGSWNGLGTTLCVCLGWFSIAFFGYRHDALTLLGWGVLGWLAMLIYCMAVVAARPRVESWFWTLREWTRK